MKSFVVVNHHRQWKVSYGEGTYWKIGARWFEDYGDALIFISDNVLRNELEERLSKIKYDRDNYCDGY